MTEPTPKRRPKPGHICHFCHQRVKWFKPRMPVKDAKGTTIGFCHPGCALRGSKVNERAKQMRELVTGRARKV